MEDIIRRSGRVHQYACRTRFILVCLCFAMCRYHVCAANNLLATADILKQFQPEAINQKQEDHWIEGLTYTICTITSRIRARNLSNIANFKQSLYKEETFYNGSSLTLLRLNHDIFCPIPIPIWRNTCARKNNRKNVSMYLVQFQHQSQELANIAYFKQSFYKEETFYNGADRVKYCYNE